MEIQIGGKKEIRSSLEMILLPQFGSLCLAICCTIQYYKAVHWIQLLPPYQRILKNYADDKLTSWAEMFIQFLQTPWCRSDCLAKKRRTNERLTAQATQKWIKQRKFEHKTLCQTSNDSSLFRISFPYSVHASNYLFFCIL